MGSQDCLIYTESITPRVEYIFNLILCEMLGLNVIFTQSKSKFIEYQGVKINFSKTDLKEGLFIQSHELLFQEGIQKHIPVVFDFEGVPAFYKTSENSLLPFDPFAASFFLVTRYEEYYQNHVDQHGRYQYENSLAYKYDFINQPLVNQWSVVIAKIIQKKYPQIKLKENSFEFKMTIDVDIAYAHKHKGFVRASASMMKLFFSGKLKTFVARCKTIVGLKKDEFDTFDYILSLKEKFNFDLFFFFLLGNGSKYDRNLSWRNKGFQRLIKRMAENAEVGIHFSYQSDQSIEIKKKEIERLSKIIGEKVKRNRQHFLKMELPRTYQELFEIGIEHDFTMGYPNTPGFRASICSPYKFYNLANEERTNLTIHPFAFMEGNFIDYLELNAKEAWPKIKELIETTKKIGGTFYSLWHNHSLSGIGVWEGWDKLFEEMIEYVYKNEQTN